MTGLIDGILIGGAGGAFAGIVLWLFDYLRERRLERHDMDRVYTWLLTNTANEEGRRYRTTRTIASYTNLTQDRVRFVCSYDERIVLSTGPNEDVWGLIGIVRKSDPPLDAG
jgi:hypothetical protein